MSLSQATPLKPLHAVPDVGGERCPLCDQAVTSAKLQELRARIQADAEEQARVLEQELVQRFDEEKALAEAKARVEIERIQKEARGQVDAAKLVAGKQAEEMAARVSAAEAEKKETESRARQLEENYEREKSGRLEEKLAADGREKQLREQNAAAVSKLQQDMESKTTAAREEGALAATAQMSEQLAAAEEARQKEVTLRASERAAAEKREQELQDGFAAREAQLRDEATKLATLAVEKELAAANAATSAALAEVDTLKIENESRLQEQRDALEKAITDARNEEKANAFVERQAFDTKLADLQRQLQKKNAEELGEGAEVDLYEDLKRAFEHDKIKRVNKGAAGADVIHEIVHNGVVCGTIVYDSKNRNQWRTDFVTKLREDQLTAKAEHAVLSSAKFPAGAAQLHLLEGVIVVNPARVVVVAQLLRDHIIQTHQLRISQEERKEKMAELYAFMISDQCANLLDAIDSGTTDLLKIDADEKKAHDKVWTKRGTALRAVEKKQADLRFEIQRIVGGSALRDEPRE